MAWWRLFRGAAVDAVLEVHHDRREPSQDVRRGGDHPGPDGLWITVKRHGIIGQPLGEEPERKRLFHLVSRPDGGHGRLGREVRGVAAQAGRGLVMGVGDAVGRVPLARGVGVPAIAGQELEVHRRAHGPRGGGRDGGGGGCLGLFLRQIGGNVEELGAEGVIGLAGVDVDVVAAPGQDPRGELVRTRPRRPLALEALGIDPAGVLDELSVLLLIEADIGRHVAVDEVEGEEPELRQVGFQVEHEPVGAGGRFGLGGGFAAGEIGPVVGEAVDGPAEDERIGVLPAVVGLGFEGHGLGDHRAPRLTARARTENPIGPFNPGAASSVTPSAAPAGWRTSQVTSGSPRWRVLSKRRPADLDPDRHGRRALQRPGLFQRDDQHDSARRVARRHAHHRGLARTDRSLAVGHQARGGRDRQRQPADRTHQHFPSECAVAVNSHPA